MSVLYTTPARPDDIIHRSHKYIDKKRSSSGKWLYIYSDETSEGKGKHTPRIRGTRIEQPSQYFDKRENDQYERRYHGDKGIDRHNVALKNRVENTKKFIDRHPTEKTQKEIDTAKAKRNDFVNSHPSDQMKKINRGKRIFEKIYNL